MFKKLNHVNNSLYEDEFAKAEIEHKERINVGFLIFQPVKLRLLELYYNFFTKFCDVTKFEEFELDTDSLHLALAERELEDYFKSEMRAEWPELRSNDCVESFTAAALANFIPRRTCFVKHK